MFDGLRECQLEGRMGGDSLTFIILSLLYKELKKPRRRRRGQRPIIKKMIFYFTYKSYGTLKSFTLFITVKLCYHETESRTHR